MSWECEFFGGPADGRIITIHGWGRDVGPMWEYTIPVTTLEPDIRSFRWTDHRASPPVRTAMRPVRYTRGHFHHPTHRWRYQLAPDEMSGIQAQYERVYRSFAATEQAMARVRQVPVPPTPAIRMPTTPPEPLYITPIGDEFIRMVLEARHEVLRDGYAPTGIGFSRIGAVNPYFGLDPGNPLQRTQIAGLQVVYAPWIRRNDQFELIYGERGPATGGRRFPLPSLRELQDRADRRRLGLL